MKPTRHTITLLTTSRGAARLWVTVLVYPTLREMRRVCGFPRDRFYAACQRNPVSEGEIARLYFAQRWLQPDLIGHEKQHCLKHLEAMLELDEDDDEEIICELAQALAHGLADIT